MNDEMPLEIQQDEQLREIWEESYKRKRRGFVFSSTDKMLVVFLVSIIIGIAYTFNNPYEEYCAEEVEPYCMDMCLGNPSPLQRSDISQIEIDVCQSDCCIMDMKQKNMFGQMFLFGIYGVAAYLMLLMITGRI